MTLALARQADGGRRPGRLPLRAIIPMATIPAAMIAPPRVPHNGPPTALPRPASAATGGIDQGTCVRISLATARARAQLTHEGVVIAGVPPGSFVGFAGVVADPPRSSVERYLIECGTCELPRQVVRCAIQMEVVWP